jgi:hypothetical protein
MQFIPSCCNYSAHVKPFVEDRHCLSFGTFVCFLVTNERFDLLGKKATDGSFSPSGENSGFLKHVSAKTYRHVLLFVIW